MAGSSFQWTDESLQENLRSARHKVAPYITKVTKFHALAAEAFAKNNAPWTDRTGNARQGLAAVANNQQAANGRWEIIVSHAMPYGIWLEVRHAGKYAVIMPTIDSQAPLYFATAQKVFDEMFKRGGGTV